MTTVEIVNIGSMVIMVAIGLWTWIDGVRSTKKHGDRMYQLGINMGRLRERSEIADWLSAHGEPRLSLEIRLERQRETNTADTIQEEAPRVDRAAN